MESVMVIRMISGVFAIVVLAIIVMRRKHKAIEE